MDGAHVLTYALGGRSVSCDLPPLLKALSVIDYTTHMSSLRPSAQSARLTGTASYAVQSVTTASHAADIVALVVMVAGPTV